MNEQIEPRLREIRELVAALQLEPSEAVAAEAPHLLALITELLATVENMPGSSR